MADPGDCSERVLLLVPDPVLSLVAAHREERALRSVPPA